MESPLAVANYFIKKSLDTGIPVDPLKIIKLVYLAHGWNLGINGEPLLNEAVQAWQYGPVVPSVYHEFKKYKSSPITKLATRFDEGKEQEYTIADTSINGLLDKVWDRYRKHSGIYLSGLTHQSDTPWEKTWNLNGGKERMGANIPNDLIKEHYQEMIEAVAA